jgi:RimJ/RimL family protein N-acetyltransferase
VIDQPLKTRAGRTLHLRTLTVDGAGEFARHIGADRANLRVHMPWPDVTATPEGARAWIEQYARGSEGRVVLAGVFDGAAIVGGGLLMNHEPDVAAVEVGCWVVSGVEGQGVARAACQALIAFARERLGAERVVQRNATVNARSRALAERLGFRHEGVLRSSYVLRPARRAPRQGSAVARRRRARRTARLNAWTTSTSACASWRRRSPTSTATSGSTRPTPSRPRPAGSTPTSCS